MYDDATTPEASTAPTTATPSVCPNCRLVEATAAATPACARGIPDTAVLVIGAFTKPNPIPNNAYPMNRETPDVSASNPANITALAVIAVPAINRDIRGP